MKNFINNLLSKSSDVSSKRFIGLWCVLFGTLFGIAAAVQLYFKIEITDNQLWLIGLFLGTGVTAFGITAFSKS